MSNERVTLLGCGDVGPVHEPVQPYSELARSTLGSADLRFAQIERVYSERGAMQLHAGVTHSRVPPRMASLISDCGFDIVSCASNHAMDWGPEAFCDSLAVIRERGQSLPAPGVISTKRASPHSLNARVCALRFSPTVQS